MHFIYYAVSLYIKLTIKIKLNEKKKNECL